MSTKDKPTKLERVNWTIHRALTRTTEKTRAANWVVYGVTAITTTLLFAADPPDVPKWPRGLGD